MPKMISICIPIYNPDPKFFRQLILSIKNQTYKEFELVISDDGDSWQRIQGDLLNVNYIYVRNLGTKGIFYNLNNAINHSKYDYIQIFCQDDIMREDFLYYQHLNLIQNPDYKIIYSQNKQINEDFMDNFIRLEDTHMVSFIEKSDLVNKLLIYGCLPGNLSPVMIKRELLIELNLFNPELLYASDFNFWIKCSEYTGMLINLDKLLFVRKHSNQASSTLEASAYLNDMKINIKLLIEKSTFNWWFSFVYANILFGDSILKKCLSQFKKDKKIVVIFQLFACIYPINFFLICISQIYLFQFFFINIVKKKIGLKF